MRSGCWIIKATGKESEYVITIAFARQKYAGESASLLHYTTILPLLLLRKTLEKNLKPKNTLNAL
jgi:hypothetical protein